MSQATDATLVSSIKQYFITIYTEIGTRNVTHAFFWQVVATALIAIPLRPVLLALSNLLTPQQGKYKPPRFITSIVTRLDSLMRAFHTFIDGVHYFWALLMLVISIPYTRMQDSYKWNCYWSWVFEAAVTIGLLIPTGTSKLRAMLRRFTLVYLLYLANGVMAVANFGYIYYKLASYTWPYIFVHFAPPAFIWFYCFLKSREIPDDYNPLYISYFHFVLCLIGSSFFQYWYLGWFVDVLAVYELESMDYLYVIGGVAPQVTNLAVMIILFCSKALHMRIFGFIATEEEDSPDTEPQDIKKKHQ